MERRPDPPTEPDLPVEPSTETFFLGRDAAEQTGGDNPRIPYGALTMVNTGEVLRLQKKPGAEAIPTAERAVALFEKAGDADSQREAEDWLRQRGLSW